MAIIDENVSSAEWNDRLRAQFTGNNLFDIVEQFSAEDIQAFCPIRFKVMDDGSIENEPCTPFLERGFANAEELCVLALGIWLSGIDRKLASKRVEGEPTDDRLGQILVDLEQDGPSYESLKNCLQDLNLLDPHAPNRLTWERLPRDLESEVNLASLDWRRGFTQVVQGKMDDLRESHPCVHPKSSDKRLVKIWPFEDGDEFNLRRREYEDERHQRQLLSGAS